MKDRTKFFRIIHLNAGIFIKMAGSKNMYTVCSHKIMKQHLKLIHCHIQCGFGTNPSTAKFRVAAGNANRIPSSSGFAITWQPRRDLQRCSEVYYVK